MTIKVTKSTFKRVRMDRDRKWKVPTSFSRFFLPACQILKCFLKFKS